MQEKIQGNALGNKKVQDKDDNPAEEKGMSRGRKITYGLLSGCFVILIILGVAAYFFLRSASEKVGEEIERAMENTENSQWQEEWQKFSSQLEEELEGTSEDLEESRGVEGDSLSDGNISIKLDSVAKENRIGSSLPGEGYEYMIFDLNLTNQTGEEIIFYNSDLHLRDSIYTEYRQANVGEDSGYSLFKTMQNILPGRTIEGKIIFEVNDDAKGLELIYVGEKKIIFEINNI